MGVTGGTVVTMSADEYLGLLQRLDALEGTVAALCAYVTKRRELAVVEFGFIEDMRGLPRTKPSRHK